MTDKCKSLENLDSNEIMDILSLTEDKLLNIRTQIDFAKSNAASKKEYSDPVWFRNASHALRKTGQQHQSILRELSKRKKERQELYTKSIGVVFIDVAYKKLDSKTFEDIMTKAKDIIGGRHD